MTQLTHPAQTLLQQLDGFSVQIDAERPIAFTPTHPLAAHRRRPAEILAQHAGASPAQLPKGPVDEVDLRSRILDRELIKAVTIGTCRHRRARRILSRGHGPVDCSFG